MRRIFFTSLALFIGLSGIKSQTIYVSGNISSNTTWNADTVKITGDVTVGAGVVLTVNPGTYVEVQGYHRITVGGSVKAIGTKTDTIVFTAHDITGFWEDTLSVAGGWAGFNITNTYASADTSFFEFCKIQYGKRYGDYGGDIKGGAIFASDYGTLIIRNSFINSNTVISYTDLGNGSAGGAVYCKRVNIVNIENNRFEQNRSFERGGAVFIDPLCQVIISNNIFKWNRSIGWSFIPGWTFVFGSGGAVGTSDDTGFSPTISNNQFFNNRSNNGIIYTSNRHGLIFNNIICNNSGSGIMDGHQLSTTRIYNNTIVNNQTANGGVQLFSAAVVYNNICWGNEPHPGWVTDQIQIGFNSTPTLFYNCVQYGNGGLYSTDKYPEFELPSAGSGLAYDGAACDWKLKDNSPCVNRGTVDTSGLFIPEFDLIGNPRIYGVSIEMGCYENQSVLTNIFGEIVAEDRTTVYPNPGTDRLNIESVETEAIFELVTMTGQIVIREQVNRGWNSLNTESLATGIYFYRMLNRNKETVKSGRWIKQ